MSTSSLAPGARATVRGSSGSENTSRIVEVSSMGRNASGVVGGAPLTATSVGAAARGCVLRVVKWSSGPASGRFCAFGATAGRAYTEYVVPGASAAPANWTLRPSPTTSAFASTGPSGPARQNAPVTSAPVPAHGPSALASTGSENVTTTRAPSGTSSCASIGYV
jgi:hypothetical protein